MAERQQAAIAEQQVEGAGEQREAQHLHQEDGIEQERRDQQQHAEPDEDRAHGASALWTPAWTLPEIDGGALSAMDGL